MAAECVLTREPCTIRRGGTDGRGIGEVGQVPTERVPVIFHGRRVGTLPGDFDAQNVKSLSWLYDPRPDNFKREDGA
jgi:hypothetical protein